MTEQYKAAVEKVHTINDPAYSDFMARRLVEMAGNIVMGYLMVTDASRNAASTDAEVAKAAADLARSAKVYINLGRAEVARHAEFVANVAPADMAAYKVD